MKLLRRFVLLSFVVSSAALAAGPKVAIVFDKGGKDDKSFNSSAYSGAMEAKEKLGAVIKYVEAPDANQFEPMLKDFAKKDDVDLIVAIGVSQSDALSKIAPQFPKKKFLIVDAEVKGPNVATALFQEHEGSYLVGAMAALKSKTGVVGFIGGMDIPLIRRFQMGYEAGVHAINPKAKVLVNYVGVTGDAWHNPAKAKELALAQISEKADVIFHAAGASGTGLFDAVEEKNGVFAIGVDSNQNWVKSGKVLTSMLKRVDNAIFETVADLAKGKFTPGVRRFGLKDGGIDYAMDSHNQSLVTPEMKKKVDELKAGIIAGKIKVPDYYEKKK
ncbi:MAG: BMP family ABC transporter substrate-binding protein [Bdellovibrionales bacterium]|nr:BMP family ABC transporter substrate-binding protein [Bdellovibrionales bacterium]